MSSAVYELVEGDVHRHGGLRHAHPHSGPHRHDADSHEAGAEHPDTGGRGDSHAHGEAHSDGHSHGLIDASIKHSREGVRAVARALAILGCTAALQALVFALTGSL